MQLNINILAEENRITVKWMEYRLFALGNLAVCLAVHYFWWVAPLGVTILFGFDPILLILEEVFSVKYSIFQVTPTRVIVTLVRIGLACLAMDSYLRTVTSDARSIEMVHFCINQLRIGEMLINDVRIWTYMLCAIFVGTSMILWSFANFVALKGFGHFPFLVWLVAPAASAGMLVLCDFLLKSAVLFHETCRKVLDKLSKKEAQVSRGNGICEWRLFRKSVKAQRPLSFGVGIFYHRMYHYKQSTIVTYYYTIMDYTITAILSFDF
ncbi:hypothetical protein Fcan01_16835 [Folsomia candida]|uniref:Uncharacterized protein n=1 Tax=Folsomia candida TaxID=158441 RepID=A0A226DUI2_FOLCA|nr:hypothetical protein Fcan01_16835 [Folsomia candida]